MQDLHQNYFGYRSPERPQDISWLDGRINSALLEVVYIPGAADIRNTMESGETEIITTMSKEDKVLAYIRQNGSISMQKVMETCNYRSRTGERKLIDKMINADFIKLKNSLVVTLNNRVTTITNIKSDLCRLSVQMD